VPVPDPSRRGIKRNLGVDELKSPVRPVGYITPTRHYREVSNGHLVRMEEAA
jgi:peptide/nickel transport system ATP-binding protein